MAFSRTTAYQKPHITLPLHYHLSRTPAEVRKFADTCVEAINLLIDKINQANKVISSYTIAADSARSSALLDMLDGRSGESSFAFASTMIDETYKDTVSITRWNKKIDIITHAMNHANKSNLEKIKSKMLDDLADLDRSTTASPAR